VLRESLGEEVEIMFDAFQGWDLQYALAWAREVEEYHPYWIEEAFPVADLESFIQLSQRASFPVATGEHFANRWEVQQFLKNRAIQIVQADPEWCGGVSELVKMCHLASVHGAKVVPHGHNIHAALHAVVSQSPAVCPLVEYLINSMPWKVFFQKDPLLTDNGILALPTKPGFGIELDDRKFDDREVITRA
jgi:L-alanine-DL-glutamate epimerase-like enolase superfamily enzyme